MAHVFLLLPSLLTRSRAGNYSVAFHGNRGVSGGVGYLLRITQPYVDRRGLPSVGGCVGQVGGVGWACM